MAMSASPYAGGRPRSGTSAPHPPLPFDCVLDVDRRDMLAPWFLRDLEAWERRDCHKVTVRADAERSRVIWKVDGRRIASTDLSDVVYGRSTLETALERSSHPAV